MAQISARRAATQERLLDAAMEIIAEHGTEAASVEEISERAGFTRGAFYSNFDSKDALFDALIRREAERRVSEARQVLADIQPNTPLDELLDRAVRSFFSTHPSDTQAAIVHTEMRLNAVRNPELRASYLKLNGDIMALIQDLIETEAERQGLRLLLPVSKLWSVLDGVFENIIQTAVIEGHSPSSEESYEQLTLVLRAVIAPK
ncbi:MAG: TetR/AcrR family transcriptional regulator [Propionibacteriaceae bacterium]|jgi:AcrR family transcriptional regulator|nr:TetR/AcrR family transcriptional regulator [Propionibacteriaceae bacterium]